MPPCHWLREREAAAIAMVGGRAHRVAAYISRLAGATRCSPRAMHIRGAASRGHALRAPRATTRIVGVEPSLPRRHTFIRRPPLLLSYRSSFDCLAVGGGAETAFQFSRRTRQSLPTDDSHKYVCFTRSTEQEIQYRNSLHVLLSRDSPLFILVRFVRFALFSLLFDFLPSD